MRIFISGSEPSNTYIYMYACKRTLYYPFIYYCTFNCLYNEVFLYTCGTYFHFLFCYRLSFVRNMTSALNSGPYLQLVGFHWITVLIDVNTIIKVRIFFSLFSQYSDILPHSIPISWTPFREVMSELISEKKT